MRIPPLNVIGLALALASGASVGEAAPDFYVDKDACPFECCRYGKWTVTRNTVLVASPSANAQQVRELTEGESVMAGTGEVHVFPGVFAVIADHKGYSTGDVLKVFTPLGEGFFKLWVDGHLVEEELGSPARGGANAPWCIGNKCWGFLKEAPRYTWWVHIEATGGVSGWSSTPEAFSGSDACS